MRRSRILGVGSYLPERVVTNHDLEQWMDTTDEWIQQRSGIRERHFAAADQATSDLGLIAARRALEAADLAPESIDFIVFATSTSDYLVPGSGCFLQHKLGIGPVGALDVRAQCSGFLYALSVADLYVRAGEYDRVLVVGAEVQSAGLDLSDAGRDTAVLFADGAGAVVLGASDDPERGLLGHRLHADGRFADALAIPAPGTVNRPFIGPEHLEQRRHRLQMDGRLVFKNAVETMPAAVREVADHCGVLVSDLALVIPHQANTRIIDALAGALHLPTERVVNNIAYTGNTTAATIPIALDQVVRDGRLKTGDLLALVAFGSGFTWAASLIRW